MWNDEIVEDIRRVRDQYAREHHYDIDEIAKDIKAKQQASEHPLVCFPPKRPSSGIKPGDENVDAA